MFLYKYSTLMLAITVSVMTPVYASIDVAMLSNTVSPYVVGGDDVDSNTPASENFMASLRNNKVAEKPFCGATVINDQWVLTAAHCVVTGSGESTVVIAPSDITITVGLIDNSRPLENHIFSATHVVVYPDYSPEAIIKTTTESNNQVTTEVITTVLDNDVALIRVNRKFSRVGQVNLPTQEQAIDIEKKLNQQWNNSDFQGSTIHDKNLKVLGWGVTDPSGSSDSASDTLQQAMLSLFPIDLCYNRLESNEHPGLIIDNPANITKLCALPSEISGYIDNTPYGIDACFGDSGGPILAQDDNGKWFQIGIVSELKCGSMTLPSFYARVGTYTNWIADNISKVPSNPITPPDFLADKYDDTDSEDCNDSLSANNCNIGKDRDSGGSFSFIGLLLLCSGVFFRRLRI